MLLETESAGRKSVNRMTTGTVGRHCIDGKLPLVVVSMTGCTTVVCQRLRKAVRRMALPAINRLVLSLQGEVSQVMIKGFGLYLRKRFFIMTVNAL